MDGILENALRQMKSEDSRVHEQALDVIEDLRPANAYDIIQSLHTDPSSEVRSAVASHLGSLGDERAIPLLLELAESDPDQDTRAYAYEALKNFHDDRILQRLLKELYDGHPSRRVPLAIADSLGEYHSSDALQGLQHILASDDPYVCNTAVDALYKHKNGNLVDMWVDLLVYGKNDYVSETAARALGEIGSFDTFNAVREYILLGEGGNFLGAIFALGYIDDQRAVDTLVKVIRESKDIEVVEAAILALVKHSDPKALVRILDILSSANISENIKISAIEMIRRYTSQESEEILKVLSQDQDEHIRKMATIILSHDERYAE